jgi:hypothetical protein
VAGPLRARAARELEPVVHEASTVHRLDRRTDRRPITVEPLRQAIQTVGNPVAPHPPRPSHHQHPVDESRRLRLRSKPAYNILGPPLDSSSRQAGACHWRRPFFMAVLTMEVLERHARTRAITYDTLSPGNQAIPSGSDATRDVARVVSDVSVLCPQVGVSYDNSVLTRRVSFVQRRVAT